MDKDREISGDKPNAAPKSAVDDAIRRVKHLGWKWEAAVIDAGLSRNVAYTLKRYEASVGSLRKLEEWLIKQEAKRPRAAGDSATVEWARLGEEMYKLDPPQFEQMLEGLRELVKIERQREGAILKFFRPNPDRIR